MAKHEKEKRKTERPHGADAAVATGSSATGSAVPPPKMKDKEYPYELRRLHGELVAMQEWG
jgi:polyphosphate kinase